MKVTKEFKIGLVVIAAVSAFVWGFSFLKGSQFFSDEFYLYAVYPKIDNLIPANPVQINGYKIGQVRSISLINRGGKNQVLVKLMITEEVAIPKNSTAKVVATDLLGSKVVEVVFSGEKDMAENGDTLKAETEPGMAESFNQQLGPLQAKAESLISSVDSVMKVVELVLNARTRDNIEQTFESVRRSILSIEQISYKMDDLLASEKPKLSNIFTNLSGITTNLNKSEQKINNILNNFSNLSDSLSKSQLKTAVANADATLRELNTLMVKINSGQGTVGKLLKNDSLYNNLNKSSASLDSLLKDLKENPKRYVHFSIFGRKK